MSERPSAEQRIEEIQNELKRISARLEELENTVYGETVESSQTDLAVEAESEPVPARETLPVLEEAAGNLDASLQTPPTEIIEPLSEEYVESPSTEPSFAYFEKIEEEPAWQSYLRKIKILPPRDNSMSVEVLIGSWWLPRLAVLLGVIGIAWLTIYFSRSTPPPLRFCGILGASFGISVLGYLMERRGMKDFGAVLFASGLALIYFTVFAGYAFDAVKVFDSAAIAATMQFAVIALIVICALWRNSHTIAAMAIFLGYAACFFSFVQDLPVFALINALLLACAGSFFYLARGWKAAYGICIPGAYLIYACIALFEWSQSSAHRPEFYGAIAFPVLAMILFIATDLRACLKAKLMPRLQRRLLQIFSSSSAIILSYLVVRIYYTEHLSAYYFIFGSALTGTALVFWFLNRADAIAQSYFIKGTALLTLGLIAELGGYTRWIGLAAEAFVLLFSARRSRLVSIEVAMIAVWYASLYYFDGFMRYGHGNAPLALSSVEGILSFVYLFASATLLSLQGRWFRPERIQREDAEIIVTFRDLVSLANALLVGLAAIAVVEHIGASQFIPLRSAVLAALLGLLAIGLRHWIPLAAACICFLSGYGYFVLKVLQQDLTLRPMWLNAAALIAFSMATLAGLQQLTKSTTPRILKSFSFLQWAIHPLWLLVLHLSFSRTFPDFQDAWLADLITAFVLVLGAAFIPLASLADCAWLSIFAVLLELGAGRTVMDELVQLTPTLQFWTLFIAPFAFAILFASTRLREKLILLKQANAWQWIHLGLAAWIACLMLGKAFPDQSLMWMLAVGSVGLTLLHIWPGINCAIFYALVYVALSHLIFHEEIKFQFTNSTMLIPSLIVAMATLAQALLMKALGLKFGAKVTVWLQSIIGMATLFLLFRLFSGQSGEIRHYITIFWGISASIIFVAGLIGRIKPLRIVGLLGLALCLPRLFLIDIQSTVYRIGAFIGLCFVLLVVGYIYNRYRGMIERVSEDT